MAFETRLQIDARHAREQYAHEASKIKGVLHTPLIVLMMLYPTLIGFTLVSRNQNFAVVNPIPSAVSAASPGPDAWVTTSAEMIGRTCMAFTAVSFVYVALLSYLRFHGREGALRISPAFSRIVPAIFWFCTVTYFFYYVTTARYGVARVEWIIFAFFSCITLVLMCYLIWIPLKTDKVTSTV